MHQNICINHMGGGMREAGAELHSLGHQRATPHWWCDYENQATSEGRIFGGQGNGASLPTPSFLPCFSVGNQSRTIQEPAPLTGTLHSVN